MRLVCIVHVWKSSMLWAITVFLFCKQLTIIKLLLRIISFFVSLLYLVGREHDFFLMNDPQSFLRGKLIHGPGAWLMSPSPLRQWETPTILHPMSTSGASLSVSKPCLMSNLCVRRAGAVLGDHLHLPAKPSLDVAQGGEGQDTQRSAQRGTNLTTEQEPARAFLPLPLRAQSTSRPLFHLVTWQRHNSNYILLHIDKSTSHIHKRQTIVNSFAAPPGSLRCILKNLLSYVL